MEPFTLGVFGPIVFLIVVGAGLSLAFILVSAIVRISRAFESASRSLADIAKNQGSRLP